MTTSPGLTTLNVIIEEAQHQQRDRSGVTQLPEPVSPSYRSQSPNWNTATGANMSTMNRDSTGTAHEACDSACDRSVTAARRERHDCHLPACLWRRWTGIEPGRAGDDVWRVFRVRPGQRVFLRNIAAAAGCRIRPCYEFSVTTV